MMTPFVKMHGLGNDFVVFEAKDLPAHWQTPGALGQLAVWACDRNKGVGGDGILVIHPTPSSTDGAAVAQFIYYNNDGTVAEMCGNGVRCYARYLADKGLVTTPTFTLNTLAGPVTCTVSPDGEGNPHGHVAVDMGTPRFTPNQVPFVSETPYTPGQSAATLTLEGQPLSVWPVSMGNPHAVLFTALQPHSINPSLLGPLFEKHPAFPAKTNVEFVEQLNPTTLKVTVWERGCGWTLACGTGACGVVASAIRQGLVPANQPITVQLPGGDLSIQWSGGEGDSVLMTGPATVAFEGSLLLPASILAAMGQPSSSSSSSSLSSPEVVTYA